MPRVLIVGGGPVGLSMAIRLAQLDVPVTLVERHPSTATFPRVRALSTRSMEIYRTWGLEEAITAAGRPRDQLAFYTGGTLVDPAGTRIVVNPSAHQVPSPTYTMLCSQDHLEPLLRRHAERLAPGSIRFGVRLGDFRDGPGAITTTVHDHHTGQTETLVADYLVAADGARSGIRQQLGIAMQGPAGVSHNVNILFLADLMPHVADRLAAVYTINQPHLHGTFLAVDNDRRWLFNLVTDSPRSHYGGPGADSLDDLACVQLVRTAAGLPELAVTVVDQQVWRASAQVADRFQHGRVFLVGDAAHVTTPYGGYGLNCGIADVDNLAWKLAAVHHGWAAPALLDTYEPERRPVAQASAHESHRRLLDTLEAHRTGTPPRGRPSEGLVLGYRYTSAAVIDDGVPPPDADPVAEYVPSASPGCRAPHLWLDRAGHEVSTLDLLGTGLTLFTGSDATWARRLDTGGLAPLTILPVDAGDLRDPHSVLLDTYGIAPDGAVLVRPDGHVGWRTPTTPTGSVADVLATLLGWPG